jgi:ElaB/YqjD/DUF883 family membrane-anchored ribosome-binding protein
MNDHTVSTNSGPTDSRSADSRLEEKVDRLAQGAHSGVDAASEAAGPAIDRMAAGAHRAIDSADEAATNAVEALEAAGVKGEELLAAASAYMRENPVLSLSMAVAAGFVLSRLLLK